VIGSCESFHIDIGIMTSELLKRHVFWQV
jgi:hypothetical protein